MANKVAKIPTRTRKAHATAGGRLAAVRASAAADNSALDLAAEESAPAGLAADITDELAQGAPTFGNVLSLLGEAVLGAQKVLDDGVIQAINSMADTKIELVTTVIQHLDDDGLPSAKDTEIVTQELSLLPFVMPTMHRFERVGVSLDLEAASADAKSGIIFKQAGGAVGFGGGLGRGWSTDLGLMFGSTSVESRTQSDWARSEVRLDAELGRRAATKPPAPFRMRKGPVMLVSADRKDDSDLTKPGALRKLELTITLLTTDGARHAAQPLRIDAGVFGPLDGTTDINGVLVKTLQRDAKLPEGNFPITITFGDMDTLTVVTV